MAQKKNKKPVPASAQVVDGKLILSLPGAITPILWQMDMGETKASALTVTPSSASGEHATLSLKMPRGESAPIAEFPSKQEAVEALNVVARALESAHGRIRPASPAANEYENRPVIAYRDKRNGWKWGLGVAAVAILIAIAVVWGSLLPGGGGSQQFESAYAPPADTTARETAGVPVSADDYLNGY